MVPLYVTVPQGVFVMLNCLSRKVSESVLSSKQFTLCALVCVWVQS